MSKEKVFQDMVIQLFEAQGGHAVNMEPSKTNPGIPDINWCIQGIEGNVELKYGFDGGAAPLIRPPQVVWFRERVRAGGLPMFAYYIECDKFTDEVYIFQGRHYKALAEAKEVEDVIAVPNLRVMEPTNLVQALMSEMASWHDEIDPPSQIVVPY